MFRNVIVSRGANRLARKNLIQVLPDLGYETMKTSSSRTPIRSMRRRNDSAFGGFKTRMLNLSDQLVKVRFECESFTWNRFPIALLNPRSAKARFTGADCSLKRIARGEMVLVQGAATLSIGQRCRHEITRSLGPVQIQIGTISGDQQGPMSTR